MRCCSRCGATYAQGTQFCPKDGTPTNDILPEAPPADPFLHKMVGNFELTRRIGAGSMGSVYEGVNALVGIRVAVKLLGGQAALETELVDRFFAEARALNQIAHENIVRVVDLGKHPEGFYYCVMELLEGETLGHALRTGSLGLERALTLAAQAFDALGAAHAKGIVHRDLKPTNIMLVHHPVTGVEVLKIVDFGIAKLQKTQQTNATVSGTIMGTPAYMSPEQAAGRVQDVDARSDLYSMGLVAYEMVTGRHPFEGRAIGELIVAQITEVPEPAGSFTHLPARLDELLWKLLQKAKEHRPESASVVALELRAILHDLSAPAEYVPPPPPVMMPAAQVLVVAPPPPAPVESTPVRIPSRREPLTPVRKPVTSQAMRPVPKKRRKLVRWPFLYALALFALALGVIQARLVDVEPMVGEAATYVGLPPPPSSYGNTAKPILDGTKAAFLSAPPLADCRTVFEELRSETLPAREAELRRALLAYLASYARLEECLRLHEKLLPSDAAWVSPYLRGVAAFSFAHALESLPAEARAVAADMKDPDSGTSPFEATIFARYAIDAFNDARPDAPVVHKGLIDGFLRVLDRIRMQAHPEATK